MTGFGIFMGFRGMKEHCKLELSQVKFGKYKANHPKYANCLYCGISHFSEDKVTKLNMKTDEVRSVGRGNYFPVLSDGKTGDLSNDFGGALYRLYHKVPNHSLNRLYRHVKKDNTFEPKKPLGHATVRTRIQGAYKRMGISNFQTLRSHALRGEFINRLANDDSVNLQETMAAARHKSASASVAYQTRSTTSEANRLNALFLKRKPQDTTSFEAEENRKQSRKTEKEVEPEEEPLGSNSINEIDEEDVVVSHKNEKYSAHTQVAMDRLRNDLSRLETGVKRQNDVSSVDDSGTSTSTSENLMWNLPPPPQRSHQRHSYPPSRSYSASHRSYPAPQQVHQHSPREPSEREREINALRQRVLMLEDEVRMESFPYSSTENDFDEMYNDHIEEYEREMRMRRTRRRSNFHRNSY